MPGVLIYLELLAARAGPHDGGACSATDAGERPELREHAPEKTTRKLTSCGEHESRSDLNR